MRHVLTTDYVYDKFGSMIENREIPNPDETEYRYVKVEGK
jgi:hypothetical protein